MATTTTVLFSSGLIFCLFSTTSIAVDTLTANQTIRDDGNSNIESATGAFEMGFFSPGSSKNRYFGIWYKNISTGTVVWVANRESPLTDTSGVLRVGLNGVLVLKDGANSVIWSSNSSGSSRDPVAQLLDTGNLVIRNGNDSYPKNFLWQTFDYPRDHILPSMKVGWDLVKGLNRQLVSWKSADDPSPGNFTSGFNLSGYPQLLQWKGSVLQFRFGPWNGIEFSGRSSATPGPSFMHSFVLNEKETYYHFDLSTTSRRMVLNQNGTMQLLIWNNRTQIWDVNLTAQRDDCDHYTLCGAYSSCYMIKSRSGNVTCGCLKGFRPKNSTKWELAEWSDGCVRRTPLNCKTGDRFVKYPGLKLPDTRHSWFDQRINLEECKRVCLRNCSCTAYSNIDVREGGLGCLLWFSDLIDIRDCSNDHSRHGQDLYIRMAASESDVNKSSREKRGGKIRTIEIAALVVLVILPGLFAVHVYKKRKQRRRGILTLNTEGDARNENRREELELPLFDFEIIANTTNNFSQNNKLGEGGFGPVYKGILDDGQEIAVKRLSKTSNQGLDEFKNEVSCIAKLQHRNLVKLLGCCIQEGEMLLIYEYMPNKSLDSFIFDKELGRSLDWPTRYNIINGIARGLLYLHHDSRLRIIHRDLKAGNILLDYEMNPKISDFGMARSFGATEIQVNTRRVVGTYGYMSPEYAIDGLFSVKSDVYSFGVVVLEIVTGEKISNFYNPDQNLNLLGHAWKLFKEGKFLELMDQTIVMESSNQSELFRAIQIGLLCVQPYPRNRPCMSSVVSMLTGDAELPQPEQPGFFTERRQLNNSGQHDSSVCNELTVTFFAPR